MWILFFFYRLTTKGTALISSSIYGCDDERIPVHLPVANAVKIKMWYYGGGILEEHKAHAHMQPEYQSTEDEGNEGNKKILQGHFAR
ncbi:hypothetical protein ACLOJK_009072 [Asimina triloba]